MGPCIDVYGLSDERTTEAAWGFIERWAAPGEKTRPRTVAFDDDRTDFAAADLRAAVEPGLRDARRRYALYLKSAEPGRAARAILAFTGDGKLVFGLSVDDAEGGAEPLRRTRELLEALKTGHGCRLGFARSETSPPADEAEFREQVRRTAASSMPVFGA